MLAIGQYRFARAKTTNRLTSGEVLRWQSEKTLAGPVTIVVSSKRIIVYRNGIAIGRSRIGEGTMLLATNGSMVGGSSGQGLTVLASDQ
jgi:hypothetical protein